jgi:ankyrin repeat protein
LQPPPQRAVDVLFPSLTGWTPLLEAAWHGQPAEVQALLGAGAHVQQADAVGFTALLHAVQRGHREVVDLLLKAGASPHAVAVGGLTPLMLAAQGGHADMVARLVQSGAQVEAANQEGYSALAFAILRNDAATVQALLDANAGVDAPCAGMAPLSLAIHLGHTDMVAALARGGAQLDVIAGEDLPALMDVALLGRADMAHALVQAGADLDISLLRAIQMGRADIVTALIRVGADAKCATPDGTTALMWAAVHGHTHVVDALVQAGASLQADLLVAVERGSVETVYALAQSGADIQAHLLAAAASGNAGAVKVLVQAGAQVDAVPGGSPHALMFASQSLDESDSALGICVTSLSAQSVPYGWQEAPEPSDAGSAPLDEQGWGGLDGFQQALALPAGFCLGLDSGASMF